MNWENLRLLVFLKENEAAAIRPWLTCELLMSTCWSTALENLDIHVRKLEFESQSCINFYSKSHDAILSVHIYRVNRVLPFPSSSWEEKRIWVLGGERRKLRRPSFVCLTLQATCFPWASVMVTQEMLSVLATLPRAAWTWGSGSYLVLPDMLPWVSRRERTRPFPGGTCVTGAHGGIFFIFSLPFVTLIVNYTFKNCLFFVYMILGFGLW